QTCAHSQPTTQFIGRKHMSEHIDPSQLSSGKRDANTPSALVDSNTGPRKTPNPGARVEGGPIGIAPYTPTISLAPENVKSLPHFDEFERELQPALSAFSTAYVTLKQIAAARDQ